ncbi:MAG: divalent-cation tolerance protein CutA [Bdellovibrionota bacterium]
MESTELIVVLVTVPNDTVATELAAHLVDGRFAACVSILPGIRSVYRWEDRIEHADEIQLLIKTTRAHYPKLEAAITARHPYDTPEIVALPTAAALERYARWVAEQVCPND